MYIGFLAFANAPVLSEFSEFLNFILYAKKNDIFLSLLPYFMYCFALFLTWLSVFVFPPIMYLSAFLFLF